MAGPARKRLAVALCVLAAAVLAAATPAGATWRESAAPASGQTIVTAQLSPPASATTSRGLCVAVLGDAIVVSWTASPSTFRDGYAVQRSLTSTGPFLTIATVSSSASSYTDSGLLYSTTYYYRVVATKVLWTSGYVQVQRTTRNALCL